MPTSEHIETAQGRFGLALRFLRQVQGRDQKEVAEQAGVTRPMLSAYERGRVTPEVETLRKVLQALGVGFGAFELALELVENFASYEQPSLAGLGDSLPVERLIEVLKPNRKRRTLPKLEPISPGHLLPALRLVVEALEYYDAEQSSRSDSTRSSQESSAS